MIGGPERRRFARCEFASPDALGVVRNLPAGVASAALHPPIAPTRAVLDLQDDPQEDRIPRLAVLALARVAEGGRVIGSSRARPSVPELGTRHQLAKSTQRVLRCFSYRDRADHPRHASASPRRLHRWLEPLMRFGNCGSACVMVRGAAADAGLASADAHAWIARSPASAPGGSRTPNLLIRSNRGLCAVLTYGHARHTRADRRELFAVTSSEQRLDLSDRGRGDRHGVR